ncbi:sugar transferase [Lentisphaera profundi]|uniref:Sugar transferase n=1 Tax=Lentisphaera profundi TaxID=1658616 RepID=A0ABY7W2B6_9BACT|nr:sugar transferase [Lentisphaera profundi]WDE99146.1 sugar transferase [Lentisphaera profundi]
MKRFFDIVISSLCVFIFAPLLLVLSIFIRINLGAPIFFVQKRPGLNGKIFKMFKFRTMLDSVDKHGEPLPDAQRLTPFGSFLRKASLDELPGLFNVLKGDMSLVGPRPLLIEYLPLYSSQQARRHNVKPGITGWAQVNGRNAISWEEKFNLDVWYVENQSFWLDIKILFMTVGKVIKKSDISSASSVTMEKFTGDTNE